MIRACLQKNMSFHFLGGKVGIFWEEEMILPRSDFSFTSSSIILGESTIICRDFDKIEAFNSGYKGFWVLV